MQKKLLAVLTVSALLLSTTAAYAASNAVMFGDVAGRTHDNSLDDNYPWVKEAFLTSATNPNPANDTTTSLDSNSTAIGGGGLLFYPVSAPNDSPTGTGYMVCFDTNHWSGGSNPAPETRYVTPIQGVSNSSPVFVPSTKLAYLAAGGQLYVFDESGNITRSYPGSKNNLYSPTPVYQNQVVSYPLYVTAAQQHAPNADLWVSSQNGRLYAIDPNTMTRDQRINNQNPINLGDRLDASPALVQSSNGTPFIAVTAAYAANNQYPAGTLYLVNPQNGKVTERLPDPYGSISSVSAPIGIAPGLIMWNDTQGNVFIGDVESNGTVKLVKSWPEIGGAGATAYSSEAGYSEQTHQFILPFTNHASNGTLGVVNTETMTASALTDNYGTDPFVGNFSGSPEISADNLYVPNSIGSIDELGVDPTTGTYDNNSPLTPLVTHGYSTLEDLSTPSELSLGSTLGTSEPTLAASTNEGLELWMNVGATYTFGSDFTSSGAQSFSQPLTLTLGANNLPTSTTNLLDYPTTDQIAYSMSVNGGSFQYVTESPVYDANGNPYPTITLSTSTLNSSFKPWDAAGWSSTNQNTVAIRAYAPSSDAYGYTFTSHDSGQNQPRAQVTVVFPPSSSPPAAGQAQQPPTPSAQACGGNSNGNCIDNMGFHQIMRFLYPGYLFAKQGQMLSYTTPGSSTQMIPKPIDKLRIVPEGTVSSIHSAPSSQFSIELLDGYGTVPITFTLQAQVNTIADVKYTHKYIASWSPITRTIQSGSGKDESFHTIIVGYTPNDRYETLYRNLPVTETVTKTFTQTNGDTQLWDDSAVQVKIQSNFSANDTPDEPLSWTQAGFSVFGPWIPASEVYHGRTSQGTPVSAPNIKPYPNEQHGTPVNGTYYGNAPYGSTSAPTEPSTAEYNHGDLFQPTPSYGNVNGVPDWSPKLVVTALSNTKAFYSPVISTFLPSWSDVWVNPTGDEGVTSSITSTTTFHW